MIEKLPQIITTSQLLLDLLLMPAVLDDLQQLEPNHTHLTRQFRCACACNVLTLLARTSCADLLQAAQRKHSRGIAPDEGTMQQNSENEKVHAFCCWQAWRRPGPMQPPYDIYAERWGSPGFTDYVNKLERQADHALENASKVRSLRPPPSLPAKLLQSAWQAQPIPFAASGAVNG